MSWFRFLFSFEGRINRAKYWLFFLAVVVLEMVAGALTESTLSIFLTADVDQLPRLGDLSLAEIVTLSAVCFTGIVYTIAYFAISVKRLHDRDLSAWWLLVFWILPGVLGFFGSSVIVEPKSDLRSFVSLLLAIGVGIWSFAEFFFLPGTRGDNRFGPDPLAQKAMSAPPA